ncbi:hypothetical protein PRK78_005947 [Emydomyces testavorans]|uniref:Peroxin/Ferlin domain-containing protein n=1 Tax=Emydomyces testavorans TaxID=2070801 RepID=A0AAF0IL77_9EURO|nr:hypothetical protein PRK78_005947 [Emydomyces testavorans]
MADDPAITLVDNTLPEPEHDASEPLGSSISRQQKSITKRLTRSAVRENLARRKYAKWQRDRYAGLDTGSSREGSPSRRMLGQRERTLSIGRSSAGTDYTDFDGLDGGESTIVVDGEAQSEIDVLYENQRGWFFCGVPYYSEKSLLNLDPAAWLTKSLDLSPVDITNAQLPDPSWEWAWKTWYIDMSYDVDEEGWQYSFSFASRFAWHGTHPWYHSFVRRRCWLRKRVKKAMKVPRRAGTADDRSQAYSVEEFITARTASRGQEPSIGAAERGSYRSATLQDQEEYISPDEITNTPVLMKAITRATLDREKIEAVKAFVHMGNEELVFLEEKMPHIMSMLLFHASRRQLVEFLVSAIDEIPESTDDEAAKQRRSNLINAVDAAYRHYKDLEFWGDIGPDIAVVKGKAPFDGSYARSTRSPANTTLGIRKRPQGSRKNRLGRFICDGSARHSSQLAIPPSDAGFEDESSRNPCATEPLELSSAGDVALGRLDAAGAREGSAKELADGHDYNVGDAPHSRTVGGRERATRPGTWDSSLDSTKEGENCFRRVVLASRDAGDSESQDVLAKPVDGVLEELHDNSKPVSGLHGQKTSLTPEGRRARESEPELSEEIVDKPAFGPAALDGVSPDRPGMFARRTVPDAGFFHKAETSADKDDTAPRKATLGTENAGAFAHREISMRESTQEVKDAALRSTSALTSSRPVSYTTPESNTNSTSRRLGWLGISNLLRKHSVDKPFDPVNFKLCMEVMNALLDLSENTSESSNAKFEKQKVIQLSEYDVVRLAGDELENSWDISVVSGCRVHVLPREQDDRGPMRKILLSGSPKAIEMGEEQIMAELASPRDSTLPPFVRYRENGSAPLIRSVWTGRRIRPGAEGQIERTLRNFGVWLKSPSKSFYRQTPQINRVDQLPVPESWTIRNFADYVESVTSFRRTKAPQRIVYTNGDVHEIVVKNILFRLCSNPENRKYFSGRTMNLVISYLHHHRFFDEIRALFPLFEEFFTTRTFNTLLRSAAANYNIILFKVYLKTMKEYRIRPNGYTWVAFLQAIGSQEVRAHFLDRIYREGVLKEPAIVKHAVSAAIRHKFRMHLNNGNSGSEFIKRMTREFGEAWISTSAANKMILETSLASNLEARNDILRYCWERELKLDTITLNNALLYYVEAKHVRYGVQFFGKFAKLYRTKMNLLTWQLLWFLGCRRRSYGLCRVVWRYACLERSATMGIAKMVLRSLERPLELDRQLTIGERWHMHLGKVVVGILPNAAVHSAVENTGSERKYPDDPKMATVEHLCTDMATGPPSPWREEAAQELVQRDLKAATTHRPSIPLADIMLRAVDRDIFWNKTSTNVHLQRENTIPVPVEPRYSETGQCLERDEKHDEKVAAVYARSEIEDLLTLHDDLPDMNFKFVATDAPPRKVFWNSSAAS